ncbi:MAG: hypothetical protein P8X65_14070 [Syntrophobacterales bacterium]|jgi:hypothetical protein
MTWVLLSVGVALLLLDRVIHKDRAVRFQERLNYYIYYYRPMFNRKQFFVLIGLAVCVSAVINYLIFHKFNLFSQLIIFLLLLGLIYGMLFLLTLFDSLVLKDIDIRFHFYSMEKDVIQIFSLALFFPFIYVAFLVGGVLYLFRYPPQGIYIFKSFAGLAGLILFWYWPNQPFFMTRC